MNFLQWVVEKIDRLIEKINSSALSPAEKASKVSVLQEIKTMLLTGIEDFKNTWWDTAPPMLTSLVSTSVNSSWSSFSVNSNEAGKWYYVILPIWAPSPNSSQVRAWTDNAWTTAAFKWNVNLTAWANIFSVTWLNANTSYVLYFVAEDIASNISSVVSVWFLTSGGTWDTTAPTFSLSLSGSASSSWASVSVNMNEAWTGYYVVLASWSAAPTAAQVKAWTDSSWVVAALKWSINLASWANIVPVSGLSPSTGYILYFTAQDASANLSSVVSPLSITTPAGGTWDTTAPTFSLSLSGSASSSWASVSVNMNEAWTGYYVVLASWSAAPTAAQVKAWTDSSWVVAALKWSINLASWANIVPVSGLSPSTGYILYFTAQDASANLSSVVSPLSITTPAGGTWDTTAPAITLGISSFTNASVTANANSSETWTWYFVMLSSWSAAPTAAQIRAWTDWSWTVAAIAWSLSLVAWDNLFGVGWLTAGTSYVLHFTAEDASLNLQDTPVSSWFTTNP